MKKLPTWQELPDIGLYLDQILSLIKDIIDGRIAFQDKPLTPSMVNNYVKHGYVTKPIKKKYQKEQVARLIALTFLKTVFAISDISRSLNHLEKVYSPEELYNAFVLCLNGQASEGDVPDLIWVACQTLAFYQKSLDLSHATEKEA